MAAQAPPWQGKQGTRRITTEFKYLTEQIASGKVTQVSDLELVKDNMHQWRFKLRGFDDDTPGGKQLNLDLKDLKRSHGMDHLLMEANFPTDYPTQPFLLRVVKPRCMWYTGHVTAGGSICIESLTLSGTPGSWQSTYCVEAILTAVITNMVDCEKVFIRTASGPGGLSGPLRIDLKSAYSPTMLEYSEGEARAAFQRQQSHHSVHGWGETGGGGGGGGGGSSGAGTSSARGRAASAGTRTATAAAAAAAAAAAMAVAGLSTLPTAAVPAQPQAKRSRRQTSQDAGTSSEGAEAASGRRKNPARPLAAAPAPAPAPGASIDLTLTDDEEDSRPAIKRPPQQQQQQQAGSSRGRSKGNKASSHQGQSSSHAIVDDDDDEVLVVGYTQVQAKAQGGAVPAAVQAASRKPLVELLVAYDPAAEELEALRSKCQALQQQLEAEKAEKASASALRAPLPGHWKPMNPAQEQQVVFVPLPLPNHEGPSAAVYDPEDDVDEEAVEEMVFNGVSREDAVAALLHTDNDPSAAYAFHLQSQQKGGAAAALRGKKAKAADPDQQAVLLAEAQQVADLWRQQMAGVSPIPQIQRIERVQNWRLWTKYCLRSKEVQEAAPRAKHKHEHQLWHGSPSLDNITAIVTGGFDHRLSNLGGALGTGTYFAQQAAYSHAYSARNGGAGVAAASLLPGAWASTMAKIQQAAGRGKKGKAKKEKGVNAAGHEYAGRYAMLLCRVALGRIGRGGPSFRLPPKDCDSVSASGAKQPAAGDIFAIFDNAQAYPEYIVHYT